MRIHPNFVSMKAYRTGIKPIGFVRLKDAKDNTPARRHTGATEITNNNKMNDLKDIKDINMQTLDSGGFVLRGTWMCMTKNIGVHYNAFGGDLMAHLDEVTAAFSAEICDTPFVVTKTCTIDFEKPLKVGKIAKTYCAIDVIGNSSIKVVAEMRKYDVKKDVEEVCVRGTFVFVRVDADGESVTIDMKAKSKYPNRQRKQ
jgi:acyl-CoA hydrolase